MVGVIDLGLDVRVLNLVHITVKYSPIDNHFFVRYASREENDITIDSPVQHFFCVLHVIVLTILLLL